MGRRPPDSWSVRAAVGGQAQGEIPRLPPHEHPGGARVCGEQRVERCPALRGPERDLDRNRDLCAVPTPQAPWQSATGTRMNTAVFRATLASDAGPRLLAGTR